MTIDLSSLMSLAWSDARAAVVKFGGKSSEYFAECLKNVWSKIKGETMNVVCVAREDLYDDNNGNFAVFHMWDGEKVYTEGGCYSNFDHAVDCSLEEKRVASIWMESNAPLTLNFNKYANCDTFVGCVVTLKRSRKAPNKKPMKVICFNDGGYNSFNQYVSESIDVIDMETNIRYSNISMNCIDNVIEKFRELPFWYMSESDYKKEIDFNNQCNEYFNKLDELNTQINKIDQDQIDLSQTWIDDAQNGIEYTEEQTKKNIDFFKNMTAKSSALREERKQLINNTSTDIRFSRD